MRIHELKIQKKHFVDVVTGRKKAEIRKHDRDFNVGDHLELIEIDESGRITGEAVRVGITHILHGGDYGLSVDYSILSIELLASISPTLNCQTGINEGSDDQAFVDEQIKEALSMIESVKLRAAVEMKLAELRVLLDGANERSRSLFNAKNLWLNRAKNAYTQIDELLAERNALAAHQAELVRELTACQNVLHNLAHCGQVTPAYADDAKAVLDRAPAVSLKEVQEQAAGLVLNRLVIDIESEFDICHPIVERVGELATKVRQEAFK